MCIVYVCICVYACVHVMHVHVHLCCHFEQEAISQTDISHGCVVTQWPH